MYRVDWLQSALDEMAQLWVNADPPLRKSVTAASHSIEQRLKADAPNEGESRPRGQRLTFAAPLAVTFRLESDGATATILHVRLFRHRRK